MRTSGRSHIYVVGMRVEKFIGVEASNDEMECDTKECNSDKYILFCSARWPYNKKFTITLYREGGWCMSGYTTASWGLMKIKEVDSFGPFTHLPKDKTEIILENAYYDLETQSICFEKTEPKDENDEYVYQEADVYNNVFQYSKNGGDEYYPSGWVDVNMNLFKEGKRAFTDRPVWIFTGESATGKSTLGYYLGLNDKVVFETDSLKDGELPETIWADIIVIGNKHNITVQDIAPHLPEGTEIVTVNFMKGYLND